MSSRTRIYVGHLAARTRERDLEDVFSRYGRIAHITVKYGYGFVVRSVLRYSLQPWATDRIA